jgi:hypothetical protein
MHTQNGGGVDSFRAKKNVKYKKTASSFVVSLHLVIVSHEQLQQKIHRIGLKSTVWRWKGNAFCLKNAINRAKTKNSVDFQQTISMIIDSSEPKN